MQLADWYLSHVKFIKKMRGDHYKGRGITPSKAAYYLGMPIEWVEAAIKADQLWLIYTETPNPRSLRRYANEAFITQSNLWAWAFELQRAAEEAREERERRR